MKKIEEKSDLYSLCSLSGEMEDVTLVNNATLCVNVTRHDVVVYTGTIHKELLAT